MTMDLAKIKAMAEDRELVGIFEDISNEDYHGGPGTSNSTLDGTEQSAMHQQYNQANRKESKAMLEGTLLHEFCLEPHKVDGWVILKEEMSLLTKPHLALMEKHPGKRVVPADVFQNLQKIEENLKKLPLWQLCVARGFKELTAYAICPISGLLVKARPDVYLDDEFMLVDLKKTQDASAKEFAKSCANFNYHRQGAFHTDVFNWAAKQQSKRKLGIDVGDVVRSHIMIACEWTAPWGVSAWALDHEAMSLGTVEYRDGLEIIAKSKSQNFYPGYSTEIGTLSLPGWRLRA